MGSGVGSGVGVVVGNGVGAAVGPGVAASTHEYETVKTTRMSSTRISIRSM